MIQDLDNFVKEKLKIEKEFKLANSNNEQELIEIEKMNQELVEIIIKKDVSKYNYYQNALFLKFY